MSREALEADSDDDPFKARSSEDEEDEENSDDGDGSESDGQEEDLDMDGDDDDDGEEGGGVDVRNIGSHKKQQKPRQGAASDDDDEDSEGSEESEEGEEDSEDGSDDGDHTGSEGSSDDDNEEEEEEEVRTKDQKKTNGSKSDDREELRKLMASDQKTIAASISQAAKADAAKGKAVKDQRSTFDALLNTRIKLQKGLTAMNELSATAANAEDADTDADADADADKEAVKSAESAALTLWSNLEDLRHSLADAQTKDDSKKRKRPSSSSAISPTEPSTTLWERMTNLESDSVPRRRAILDKWSLKVRGTPATLPNARGKLLGAATDTQQTITAILDAQTASETTGERAAKRSRSNTTTTTNGNDEADPEPIYDDTPFYQSLLRDLVERRLSTSNTATLTNGLDTLHLNLPSRLSLHPVSGMRKDKVKKPVDTRASKGRKIRYHVHEKLQNFMAPEDRNSWTGRAREEFFASLLGKTAGGVLREDDDDGEDEVGSLGGGSSDGEDAVEGGLRLFRN